MTQRKKKDKTLYLDPRSPSPPLLFMEERAGGEEVFLLDI
jgi:hypothetical protein